MIDQWGYQDNTIVIINYFKWNYHWSHTMNYFASSSKTDFWWYNFYLIFKEFLPPISIVIIVSMIIYWCRFPKNILTWISLPYFIFLCSIPHKETRFLFPILMFSPLFIVAAFENLLVRSVDITNKIISTKFSRMIIYLFLFINLAALSILSVIPANNTVLLYKFLYNNEYNIKNIYTLNKIPYKKSDLLINFYRNENIFFTKISSIDECQKLEVENNIELENYDIENSIEEVQRFSYPNWNFLYKVICNKEKFIEDFTLSETNQYYMFRGLNFYKFFSEKQASKCSLIYSTFPIWFLQRNYGNWQKNLSSWYVFECKI